MILETEEIKTITRVLRCPFCDKGTLEAVDEHNSVIHLECSYCNVTVHFSSWKQQAQWTDNVVKKK